MELSLPSVFSSSLAISLLLLLLHMITHFKNILFKYGTIPCYILSILILLRGFFPFDFYAIHLTKSIYSYKIIPSFLDFLSRKTFRYFSLKDCFIFIWGLGFLFSFLKKTIIFLHFYRQIRREQIYTDFYTNQTCNFIYNNLFFKKRNVYIYISSMVDTPLTIGIFSPIIVLPKISYKNIELAYIFLHELLHFKHKDFLFNILAELLSSIHWWNPVISLNLVPSINHVQELYVDYSIKKLSLKEGNIQYLETLLKTLKHSNTPKGIVGGIPFFSGNNRFKVKQRILCLTNDSIYQNHLKGAFICFLFFLLSFTFVFEASFPSNIDEETGEHVYSISPGNSYIIKKEKEYIIYLGGDYFDTTNELIDDFKSLPIIYNQ